MGKINLMEMLTLPKGIHRFNGTVIQISMTTFTELEY